MQYLKDEHPIDVSEEGRFICFSDVQLQKAKSLITSNEGIVMLTNDEHPKKANFFIVVVEDGTLNQRCATIKN